LGAKSIFWVRLRSFWQASLEKAAESGIVSDYWVQGTSYVPVVSRLTFLVASQGGYARFSS
jgi:hypothetical protein